MLYAEEVRPIRLAENGSYIICAPEEREGVVAVVPTTVGGDGGTIETREDRVFRIAEDGLRGTEPIAEVEEVDGAALALAYEVALTELGVLPVEV